MEPLGDQISRLRDFVDDVSTQLSLHAARLKRHIQSAIAAPGETGGCTRGCRESSLLVTPCPTLTHPSPGPCAAQASTESRIFYFTAAESAFIVCLSITQAVVVRRFLNNRQWV